MAQISNSSEPATCAITSAFLPRNRRRLPSPEGPAFNANANSGLVLCKVLLRKCSFKQGSPFLFCVKVYETFSARCDVARSRLLKPSIRKLSPIAL